MSLYKRGHFYWSAIWSDGMRQMRSLETTTRRCAEQLEEIFKDELHAKRFHLPNHNPKMTFGELYARFLAEGEVRPHHIERSRVILPFFAEMALGDIGKNDMARFRKFRHETHLAKQKEDQLNKKRKADPKPLSDSTVNRDIQVIRHLLYWAADEGFIPANPLARIRLARERRQRRPVLPVAEEVKLLATCSEHLRPIVITALDTGMRRGELLNQLWEHVDFDRKLISVTHSKTPEGEHRQIPLTRRVAGLLSENRKPSGLIFLYKGGPFLRIKTGWAGALRRADIPRYRFHDLRHTFNSRLMEAGVIADVRKELMGHSQGGDVHSTYTHVELPMLRDAIGRLEDWRSAKFSALPAGEADSLPHNRNATTTQEDV